MKTTLVLLCCLFIVGLATASDWNSPEKKYKGKKWPQLTTAAAPKTTTESNEDTTQKPQSTKKPDGGDDSSSNSSPESHEPRRKNKKHSIDRVCSVQTKYSLPGIHEVRFCRNTATKDTTDCTNCCLAAYLDEHERSSGKGVIGFIAQNPKNSNHKQCVCCHPKAGHRKHHHHNHHSHGHKKYGHHGSKSNGNSDSDSKEPREHKDWHHGKDGKDRW
uniref:Uncharacterized protein n=1 Tax=Plectus sambesii TaxID=2011161 RepID=A0A914XQ17_9BILA